MRIYFLRMFYGNINFRYLFYFEWANFKIATRVKAIALIPRDSQKSVK